MADITEAIRRMIFEYTSSGADQVMQTQQAVAATTTQTATATLSLEKTFGNLERRYVETVRHQQDYQRVQQQVNAAVAQNPALQERANVVLAAAGQHYDKLAFTANKGGMAMTFLSRAMSVIIGPAGLIGVAIAGVVAAFVYLEEKLQLIPQALGFVAQALANIGWGAAAQQVGEYAARMRDVADAAAIQKTALEQIKALHPGINDDVAKQLQLLEAQLKVAKARGEEQKLSAQYELDIVQALQQGLTLLEATALAAAKRAISEENAARAIDEQNDKQRAAAAASEQREESAKESSTAEEKLREQLEEARKEIQRMRDEQNGLNSAIDRGTIAARNFGIVWTKNVADQDMYDNVFGGPKGPTVDMVITNPAAVAAMNIRKALALASQVNPFARTGSGSGGMDEARANHTAMISAMEDLTSSTDSLNTTMQSALSPFYSQDPRTTKLGFRAGVVGNPDWQTGATNANPLVAVLGAGATAPGMADGGSFTVGGGYSATDNRMAMFPVASGEEIVVNRNREGREGSGGQVVNIDNRIIVTGSVDDDALSKMKVSRYQQAQRMRAGLAQV